MENRQTPGSQDYTVNKPAETQSMKDTMSQTAETVKNKAQEYGNKAQEFGATAMNKAKDTTTAVGQSMGSLAGTIRDNAPQGGTMGSAATAVADGLQATGSYLQEKGFEDMIADLTSFVRRYPMQSLLLGAGIGYLLSRRSDRR